VRTTLTLDDDVQRRLEREVRRSGRPFKQVVNEMLRLAFTLRPQLRKAEPFQVRPRPFGPPTGASFDNVEELLDELEGASHR
jgi:hypothetical protein